jgi:hypothetical protein
MTWKIEARANGGDGASLKYPGLSSNVEPETQKHPKIGHPVRLNALPIQASGARIQHGGLPYIPIQETRCDGKQQEKIRVTAAQGITGRKERSQPAGVSFGAWLFARAPAVCHPVTALCGRSRALGRGQGNALKTLDQSTGRPPAAA